MFDMWYRTKPGMVVDDGQQQTLREAVGTSNCFTGALRDAVDYAVLDEGWHTCKLEEGGIVNEAYFRCVLEVALKMLRDGNGIKLWSGGDRLAPPTSERESPLDGDAFRMCQLMVMENHGPDSCVLAFHVFSDVIQLDWSGGMLLPLTWGCGPSGVVCERAVQMLRRSSHVVVRSVLSSCQARSNIFSCFHGSLT